VVLPTTAATGPRGRWTACSSSGPSSAGATATALHGAGVPERAQQLLRPRVPERRFYAAAARCGSAAAAVLGAWSCRGRAILPGSGPSPEDLTIMHPRLFSRVTRIAVAALLLLAVGAQTRAARPEPGARRSRGFDLFAGLPVLPGEPGVLRHQRARRVLRRPHQLVHDRRRLLAARHAQRLHL